VEKRKQGQKVGSGPRGGGGVLAHCVQRLQKPSAEGEKHNKKTLGRMSGDVTLQNTVVGKMEGLKRLNSVKGGGAKNTEGRDVGLNWVAGEQRFSAGRAEGKKGRTQREIEAADFQ